MKRPMDKYTELKWLYLNKISKKVHKVLSRKYVSQDLRRKVQVGLVDRAHRETFGEPFQIHPSLVSSALLGASAWGEHTLQYREMIK